MFIALIIFFVNIFTVFGQVTNTNQVIKKYSSFPDRSISFYESSEVEMFSLDLNTQNKKSIVGIYQQEQVTGLFYVHLNINNENKKYLTLKNEIICYLIDENDDIYFRGINGSAMRGEFIFNTPDFISTSSTLVEGNIIYSAENLNKINGLPWAVSGYGYGEKITIKKANINTIYISPGFVSSIRPDLYRANSRPKKIRLTVEEKFSFLFDLQDQPDYQTIKLPNDLTQNDTLIIEIVDIFMGAKYSDVCVNSILYDIY
jgi:hypothetical protein